MVLMGGCAMQSWCVRNTYKFVCARRYRRLDELLQVCANTAWGWVGEYGRLIGEGGVRPVFSRLNWRMSSPYATPPSQALGSSVD